MTRTTRITLMAALTLVITAIASAGDEFDIPWHTVDGGGGVTSGGVFALNGSIGQHDAGDATNGGEFTLTGGFQAILHTCDGDVDGSGAVDVLDLLAVILAWGPSGGPADINGDGAVDVLDLLAVILAWGSCN